MGIVFEAHDRVLDQAIALKVVRSEYAGDRGWAERLAREVKLARQINHPHVCRVFDFCVAQAHPFLTMELAGGGTLRDEIATGRMSERSLEQRLADARAIASGLAAIHAAGIVHRDVAPQNVLRRTDGTLALSDFGLATDRYDASSSVHGGTVAYMAPEVVRGAHASFASDIWSLGLAMHEVVFGARPAWSNNGRDILPPHNKRIASPGEQVLFQVCRACLAADPARRPSRAAEVCLRLAQRRRPRSLAARGGVVAALATAALLIAMASIGITRRSRAARSVAAAPDADAVMITPAGRPADWTNLAKVLADVTGRIGCIVALPDRQSVRFRWGTPARLEDVNVKTGARTPAPLVPEAYAEGCPDVSPDGRRIVFAGHTADERPFAFVSEHPDGHAAVPMVPIAEPSMLSDPAWFADGDRFLYEIDARHMALFSVSKNTTAVLSAEAGDYLGVFHSVRGDRVVLSSVSQQWAVDVRAFSPPSFRADLHFRLPLFTIWIDALDDRLFVTPDATAGAGGPVIAVDPVAGVARRVGHIPGQAVHQPVFAAGGLAFWSERWDILLAIAGRREVTTDVTVVAAARCGSEIVATRLAGGRMRLVHLGEDGRIGSDLDIEEDARIAQCSPDGKVLYYLDRGGALRRCEGTRCVTMAKDVYNYSLSPDGQTLAVLTLGNPSLVVGLLRSSGTWITSNLQETMNGCSPGWASDSRLWVARRRGGPNVWTELALPGGARTGRTSAGQSDCTDGNEDPAAPVVPEVRLVRRTRAQLRFFPDVNPLRLALREPAHE
jgi:tRNA A-37 threonylcarbamoyl transferase component Bud32